MLAEDRLYGDDITVPVLAKSKTSIGCLCTYVRSNRPFGDPEQPIAMLFYLLDRSGDHPRRHLALYADILLADAYAEFNELYLIDDASGAVSDGVFRTHDRRQFFVLTNVTKTDVTGIQCLFSAGSYTDPTTES